MPKILQPHVKPVALPKLATPKLPKVATPALPKIATPVVTPVVVPKVATPALPKLATPVVAPQQLAQPAQVGPAVLPQPHAPNQIILPAGMQAVDPMSLVKPLKQQEKPIVDIKLPSGSITYNFLPTLWRGSVFAHQRV